MPIVSFSREDLEKFAKNDVAFVGLDLERISSIFLAQILKLHLGRELNTLGIMGEVKHLEGLQDASATGPPTAFRHEPLKGLMKKHFTDARFILRNIVDHFGIRSGGKKKIEQLDRKIREAFGQNTSGFVDDDFVNKISYDTTIGAYEERAKKGLTGEWIVFKEHKGKNYYLTLASHEEKDEEIYKRVCDAYEFDFHFLTTSI